MRGGVTLLQPYIGRPGADWYKGTADAIYQNLDFIQHHRPDVVLILAGDHVYTMDYDVLVTFHRENGADLPIATLHLYYNTLIGDVGQIVDSGGGTGEIASTWICTRSDS